MDATAGKLLNAMQAKCLARIESGESLESAMIFGHIEGLHSDVVPRWDFDVLYAACEALADAGYIHFDCSGEVFLTNNKSALCKSNLPVQ